MVSGARVVITGVDLVSPLGAGWRETTTALKSAYSGIRPLTLVHPVDRLVPIAGEVPGFVSDPRKGTRIQQMLDQAARGAIASSHVDPRDMRIGVALGVGKQPGPDLRRLGTPADIDLEIDRGYEGQAARLSRELPKPGRAYCCYTACASGNDAIGLGVRSLRRGEADLMLCGAADSQIGPLPMLEFAMLHVLASDGSRAQPRPFDRTRDGFVVGEGAAMMALETYDHAQARGAPILAEVLGYGSASDAFSLTRGHPEASGASRAMRNALADARLSPKDIDYVNAHGTATPVGDALEARGLRNVFGSELSRVPVSSTKSMTGHLLAAAAAVEAAFCVIALSEQFVPATINHHEFDPDCDFDCVPNDARSASLNIVMSNAFGFGGQNSSLILGRVFR